MAPQEEFYNLESRQRGKKEFKFYDKIVPQPFKITPSPTPSVTPSITPTITPTPSASLPPCAIYETVCLGPLPFYPELNDIYTFWRTGEIHNLGSGNFEITCTGNTVMYTGVSTNNLIAFDTDTPTPELYALNVISGTIGCNNTVSVTTPNLQYLDPASLICDGKIFPDADDPTLPLLSFGICPSPTPSATPSITPSITPTPSPSPINANGFKLTNSSVNGGVMNGIYILANTGFYDQVRGSAGGLAYDGWVCITPSPTSNPYGNIFKNINDDTKFINVEAFNGGNVVRIYEGDLTSQVPSDPNNPFSCNTRLYDVSRDFKLTIPNSGTTYCSLAFPVSGSTTFGDVEYLPCI